MPAVKHHRQRDCRSNNSGYEVRVQGALEHVASGKYMSLREAAQEEGVSRHYLFFHTDSSHISLEISRSARPKNHHVSFTESSQQRQTLAPEEEQVLLDWCRQRVQESRPWTPQKLLAPAHEISGKTIGKKWHKKFEKCH
jgi:hypothetical protein